MTELEQIVAEIARRVVREEIAAALEGLEGNGSSSPWLTVLEAAEYLRVSERTLERLLERGKIRTSTIGRRRLLHRDELDAYAKAATRRT